MKLEAITYDRLLEMFPGYEQKITMLLTKHPCIVVFENGDFSSSEFGAKTAVAIGPDATYKDLNDIDGKWLYDLPSQRQYPAYIYVSAIKANQDG